jgi:hypothetical protein
MKQINAYQATDGTIFMDEIECQLYELPEKFGEQVDAFIASDQNTYKNGAQITVIRKSLLAWEVYKMKKSKH